MNLRAVPSILVAAWIATTAVSAQDAPRVSLWDAGKPKASLVLPAGDARAAQLARSTTTRYLKEFFDVELPVAEDTKATGCYIVLGTPANNPTLAALVRAGVELTASDIGDEGFQILTHDSGPSKYVILYGQSPRALKHACMELIFYHLAATAGGCRVDWPIDVMMKPEFAYRGIYMLPCWTAHDSIDSWRRVLRFNSELTLNRNWFWLDGFPVAGHTGTYAGTDLANEQNVQSLIDQVNGDDMKFYIGGGWLMWHHAQAVGKDAAKGTEYYLQYLCTFKNVGGFYFEPAGEVGPDPNWRMECESLRSLIRKVLQDRSDFEIAVAIGRYNNREYLELMSKLDPKHVFWWWCWGEVHGDDPWQFYPSIMEWHTTWVHGPSVHPGSSAQEAKMFGQVTSYDPGMGFGNPWTGWAKMGVDKRRDFDPHTIPYFSHEYRFRERCWNTRLSDDRFAMRLGRRLFDADMPKDAIDRYLKLADACWPPAKTDAATIDAFDAFVKANANKGTARNRDTLRRMAEAVEGLRQVNATNPAR